MPQEVVLVDTSVWVRYLKQTNAPESLHLDHLIAEDRVAICEPIKAEIISGVRSMEDFRRLSQWLDGITHFGAVPDIWGKIAPDARHNRNNTPTADREVGHRGVCP